MDFTSAHFDLRKKNYLLSTALSSSNADQHKKFIKSNTVCYMFWLTLTSPGII